MGIVDDFINALKKEPEKKPNKTYNAVISNIDNEGTIWVYVAGSDKETPTASTSTEVKRGDSVNVEWRNNKLYIAGNSTNPAVGTTRVNNVETAAMVANEAAIQAVNDASVAKDAAESAQASATIAHTAAENAQTSADSALVSLSTVEDVVGVLNWITAHGTMTLTSDVTINPAHVYFVIDPAGDYVVGGTHYSIVAEPDVSDIGTYYELSVDESVQNYVATHVVVDTEGLWLIPDSGGNKVLIATGAGSTYTTAGTYIIGKVNGLDTIFAKFVTSGAVIGQTSGAHSIIDADGQRFYATDGTTQLANIGYGVGTAQSGTVIAPYYTLGTRVANSTVGNYSMAEGSNTIASGYAAHAEGSNTIASNDAAHAEGMNTQAVGGHSHAQGMHTIAQGLGQTVIGMYNAVQGNPQVLDYSDYAFIIGNGFDDNSRSNAFTVDWYGKIQTPQIQAGNTGAIYVNANSYTDVQINFSPAMSAAPTVICSLNSTSTAGAIGSITPAVYSVSTTGATIRVFNAGTGNRTPAVNWIAMNV